MSPVIDQDLSFLESPPESCEQSVMLKIIKIIQVALKCSIEGNGNITANANESDFLSTKEIKFAKKILENFVALNDTFSRNEDSLSVFSENSTVSIKDRISYKLSYNKNCY